MLNSYKVIRMKKGAVPSLLLSFASILGVPNTYVIVGGRNTNKFVQVLNYFLL